jgi:hypothetical protein
MALGSEEFSISETAVTNSDRWRRKKSVETSLDAAA